MEMLNGIQQDNHMNNAELASLLKHASCGICTFHLKTGEPSEMLYMTDGYCVICDGTKEEIFAAYKADRLFGVAKEYHEQMNQMIIDTVLTNELHELTYQSVTLRGDKKWCKIALSPQRREDGETILYATFTDVTKQMEIQRNLDDLIHNIPGAVCLFRFNGTYLEPVVISDRYSEMLGTDARAELNNMRDLNFTHVHPDDLEMVKKEVYEALVSTGKANCTYRSYNEKKKDYIWINIQGNAIKQEDGIVYAYALYTDITKDKEVEQKLRADELIMESAAENAGVWYWNCHWRQNLAYMSKKFQDEFGLPATLSDFAKTMFTYKIVDESYQEPFMEMCEKIMNGEKEAGAVVKGYLKDGSLHWMEFKLNNVFDENGIAQEAIGIMHLVDEYKDVERKYELEKQRIEEDKELIAHAVFNLSTNETVEYAGSYLFDMAKENVSIEDIGKQICREIRNADASEGMRKAHNRERLLQDYIDGNTEFHFEYQRQLVDGRYIWVETAIHLLVDPNGTDIFMFEYCYDINLRKALQTLTEFVVNDDCDLLGLANVQDGKAIMVYGKNSYNPYHQDILEDDYQKSLVSFAENAVLEEDREKYLKMANLNHIHEKLQNEESVEFYFHVRINNGHKRVKKVKYVRYQGDENCCIFIQNDITEMMEEQRQNQKKLSDALEAAKEANHAKSTFLSQVSHEIRTPMNAIMGMTQLAKQAKDHKETEEYLDKIDSSSQFLLGIINDILDMSRIESGRMELHREWIDGCKVVMDCITMLNPLMEKKHIRFIYPEKLKNSGYEFYMDALRLQQIYMNLLNNAVKFTPDGGTIELKISNIWHNEHSGRDKIQIKDTGCGMSQEFLQRIFRPFEMEENEFSPKVQGTGLGLALVKAYVTKMGGCISVESEQGKGSVFTIELPYEVRKALKKQNGRINAAKVELQGKHILLADDHPLNREIAQKLLEHEGMIVETAVDGKDAYEKYVNSKESFDAILMDIRMPVLNGLEATKKIRASRKSDAKDIPIIAMTANAFDDDVQSSLEAGMNAHLAKPIEPVKLMETLNEYLKPQ